MGKILKLRGEVARYVYLLLGILFFIPVTVFMYHCQFKKSWNSLIYWFKDRIIWRTK